MNYEAIKKELEAQHHKSAEVGIYDKNLYKLATDKEKDGTTKNKWVAYLKDEDVIHLYNTVAKDGLFIDGDTVTLQFKGSVSVNYNYQAYKNKLLMIYPESKFDIQNVYEGDSFSFKKESGKVVYEHGINNPFAKNKVIIGCYCVIKNSRGEFIETLNMDDIAKMRNVAKTQTIWNAWESEMILKSVIKRACKRHFKDVVVNIETLDNENYDLETVNLEYQVKEQVENCKTVDDVMKVYNEHIAHCKDEKAFLELLSAKKAELKKASA